MIDVVAVRFKKAGKLYYFDPAGIEIKEQDAVIVETSRGVEFGTVISQKRVEAEGFAQRFEAGAPGRDRGRPAGGTPK